MDEKQTNDFCDKLKEQAAVGSPEVPKEFQSEMTELKAAVDEGIIDSVSSVTTTMKAAEAVSDAINASTGADVKPEDCVGIVNAAGVPPELLAPIDDATVEIENDIKVIEGRGYTAQDIMSILSDIEQVNNSFELYRNMAESKQKLQVACSKLGVGRKDQDYIDEKLKNTLYTDKELEQVINDKKKLDEAFFKRPDGTIIKLKPVQGYSEYQMKQELVAYLYAFFQIDNEAEKEIDKVNDETNKFAASNIGVLTDHLANTFVRDIKANLEKYLADENPDQSMIDKCNVLLKAFTLEDAEHILKTIPKVIRSTIDEYKSNSGITRVGQRYGKKRDDTKTASTLTASIMDDTSKSIEARFLNPTQYVEGYENLFVFYLIKYYGQQSWTDPASYTREQHNAVVMLLRALLEDKLAQEVRDEFVTNIARVWSYFYKELTENGTKN